MRIAVHSHTFRQRCPVYTPLPCTDSRALALDFKEAHMTEFSRRTMLGAAGGVMAAAAATDGLADGQPPFGPTPPVLAGAELPSFRFRLGEVKPKTWDGGWAKEANVEHFPVSQKLAGVLMSLAPGA